MSATSITYFIFTLALSSSSLAEKVHTKYGIYDGFTEDIDGKHVNKFYGIPYAMPPIGDLRFRPPRSPAESPNVTAEAKVMKPACPQSSAIFTKIYTPLLENNQTSEDCLYLNVYVPGTVDRYRTVPLAVMVWIHGGGFQFGTGSLRDGSRLAVSGDVIVVTLNYRLGVLGFLSTEDLVARGNFGLMDQVKALQWIQGNIDCFGGDPGKVTIFGESSGAYSVGLHMLSPLSEGLFTRAISQSGTAIMSGLNKHPLGRTIQVAQYLNCSKGELGTMSAVKMIRCLREVPVSDLIKADESILTPLSPFTPTVDGQFIPREPSVIIQSGKYSAVDYIVGLNNDEGSATLETLPDILNGPGINRTLFETFLSQTYLSRYPETLPPHEADVIWSALLSHYLPADDNITSLRRSYLDAGRDLFAAQTVEYATYHSTIADCYVYYFTHRPSDSRFPDYIRAAHADDIQFAFGDITTRGTKKEIQLSVDWMKAWTSFAKTGKPNFKNGEIEWTKYNSSTKYYLELTVNMTKSNLKTRLLERGSMLWNEVLPGIMSLAAKPDMSVSGQGMTALKQREMASHVSEKDWGMSEKQVEEVMLSLILVVTFLAMVCAALIRMLCYVDKKRKDGKKAQMFENKAFDFDEERRAELVKEEAYRSGCLHSHGSQTENRHDDSV